MHTEKIRCPKCGQPKEKKDFTRRDVNVSGINSVCKDCRYLEQKIRLAKKKEDSWWNF